MPISDDHGYRSFILRCWVGEGRSLRLRLVDVHRGTYRVVADLADLPALLERLVAEPIPDASIEADARDEPAQPAS